MRPYYFSTFFSPLLDLNVFVVGFSTLYFCPKFSIFVALRVLFCFLNLLLNFNLTFLLFVSIHMSLFHNFYFLTFYNFYFLFCYKYQLLKFIVLRRLPFKVVCLFAHILFSTIQVDICNTSNFCTKCMYIVLIPVQLNCIS